MNWNQWQYTVTYQRFTPPPPPGVGIGIYIDSYGMKVEKIKDKCSNQKKGV